MTTDSLVAFIKNAVETGNLRLLPHAIERQVERHVGLPDIEHALLGGRHVARRDRWNEQHVDWSYCIEGDDIDDRAMRIIVAVNDNLLVVTVVRLDKT